MEKVHNMRTTATHKDRTFRKSSTTVQIQDNFNQVPRTYNKHVMSWSSAARVSHMALPSLRPFYSSITGSLLYLSSSYLQHVQIKCNKLQEHPKNRAVKTVDKLNCKTMTTVKTVAYIVQWVHMCPTVCKWHPTSYKRKQLTSNPKQWNEHHMNWHHKTWKIQNCCTCQTPTKPLDSFCKIVGRLLQTELDTLTTVSYTAYASSSELTASVVSWTASAMKTCTSSNKM